MRKLPAIVLLSALASGCAAKAYRIPESAEFPVMRSHAKMGYQDYATKRIYDIELKFESGVQEENGSFRYVYSFANTGEVPVRIEWKYVEAGEFPIRSGELKKLHGWLKPGRTVSNAHESKTPPKDMMLPAHIYVKYSTGLDTRIGSVAPGTYVPNTVR